MTESTPLVDAYMSRNLITFSPDDDIHDAVRILLDNSISGAPVVDDKGRLVGMLSQKDCFKVLFAAGYHQDWGSRVGDYMTGEVHTIDAGTDMVKVAKMFLNSPYRRFPVLAGRRLVGQISRRDVLTAMEALW